jgi:protein TonB
MKLLLTVFLILIAQMAIGQETKKVTEKHFNPTYTEEYFVLKSDPDIRHGNYKKLGYKDCLVVNGYFKENKKDSLWTEYFWRTNIVENQGSYRADKKIGIWSKYYMINNSNRLKNKGEYINDERSGIWEFYNQEGELTQKYDFTSKELIFSKPEKSADKEYEIITESGVEKRKLDRPPMFVGGENELLNLLQSNIKYPNKALERMISGTVLISFIIETDGKVSDHQIIQKIGGDCDEEALRVVKEILNTWIPGQINGHSVKVKYVMPVKFALMN